MSMRAYVKDANGYRYRGGAPGDEHIFVSHPDYTETASANVVVDAELAEATDDENTVALTAEVVSVPGGRNGDDAIYEHVNHGDATEWPNIDRVREKFRTVQFRISETSAGNVRAGIGVNSRIEDDTARLAHQLEQMSPGALSGRSDAISPADLGAGINFGKLPMSDHFFNQTGYLLAEIDPNDPEDLGHSDKFPIDAPCTIYRVRWALSQAGDTDTIVHLRINGGGPFSHTIGGTTYRFFHESIIPAHTTLPDDDSNDGQYTNQAANKGDVISCAVHQAGDFALGLVYRWWHTSQV